jgi:hypothetical protein
MVLLPPLHLVFLLVPDMASFDDKFDEKREKMKENWKRLVFKKTFYDFYDISNNGNDQGILTEGEGQVRLTFLY